jgi:hypothetical protein
MRAYFALSRLMSQIKRAEGEPAEFWQVQSTPVIAPLQARLRRHIQEVLFRCSPRCGVLRWNINERGSNKCLLRWPSMRASPWPCRMTRDSSFSPVVCQPTAAPDFNAHKSAAHACCSWNAFEQGTVSLCALKRNGERLGIFRLR